MKVKLWKHSTLAIAATFIGLSNYQPALADSHLSAPAAQNCTVSETVINGHKYSVAKVVVHATPHQVWNILTDYDNAPKIFPQVKKCHVIKDEGTTKLLKHTVAPSGPVGTYSYVLKITEKAPHIMEWQRVSGAFKEVKGFWKLESIDNRSTLCTYASYVDGGFFIPQPLIRRQSRIDMPGVMATLKNQVENKTQIAEKPN